MRITLKTVRARQIQKKHCINCLLCFLFCFLCVCVERMIPQPQTYFIGLGTERRITRSLSKRMSQMAYQMGACSPKGNGIKSFAELSPRSFTKRVPKRSPRHKVKDICLCPTVQPQEGTPDSSLTGNIRQPKWKIMDTGNAIQLRKRKRANEEGKKSSRKSPLPSIEPLPSVGLALDASTHEPDPSLQNIVQERQVTQILQPSIEIAPDLWSALENLERLQEAVRAEQYALRFTLWELFSQVTPRPSSPMSITDMP